VKIVLQGGAQIDLRPGMSVVPHISTKLHSDLARTDTPSKIASILR